MGGSWEDHGKNAQVVLELNREYTEVMPKELRGHGFSKIAEFFVQNEKNFVNLQSELRKKVSHNNCTFAAENNRKK